MIWHRINACYMNVISWTNIHIHHTTNFIIKGNTLGCCELAYGDSYGVFSLSPDLDKLPSPLSSPNSAGGFQGMFPVYLQKNSHSLWEAGWVPGGPLDGRAGVIQYGDICFPDDMQIQTSLDRCHLYFSLAQCVTVSSAASSSMCHGDGEVLIAFTSLFYHSCCVCKFLRQFVSLPLDSEWINIDTVVCGKHVIVSVTRSSQMSSLTVSRVQSGINFPKSLQIPWENSVDKRDCSRETGVSIVGVLAGLPCGPGSK